MIALMPLGAVIIALFAVACTALFLHYVNNHPPDAAATAPLPEEIQAKAVRNAEYLLNFLRRRVNDVLAREGFSPSNHERSVAIMPQSPGVRSFAPVGVIDANTLFFRRGEYRHDAKGRIIHADENSEYLIGLTLKEMQISGAGWVARLHPEDFYRVLKAWMLVETLRGTVVLKLRFMHPYHVKYVCSVSNPVFAKDGTYKAHHSYVWQVDGDTYNMIKLPG